jgi:hypothetical protein
MSDLSSGILQAGMAGDEGVTRIRVDQLRQEKSSLLVKNRAVSEQLKAAPGEIKLHIQDLLNNISKSEQFVSAWCCRYRGILDHQALMESPERCDDLVDELIPQSDIYLTRDMDFSISSPSAAEQLEILLFQDMRQDVSSQILRRLGSLGNKKPVTP